jgi:hypothetical protein
VTARRRSPAPAATGGANQNIILEGDEGENSGNADSVNTLEEELRERIAELKEQLERSEEHIAALERQLELLDEGIAEHDEDLALTGKYFAAVCGELAVGWYPLRIQLQLETLCARLGVERPWVQP